MAQAVSARPPSCENATVENSPMAEMTIRDPAYQSRCAASKVAAGAAPLDGDCFDRNARRRSSSAAPITPALSAPRRSPSEYDIPIHSVLPWLPAAVLLGSRSDGPGDSLE